MAEAKNFQAKAYTAKGTSRDSVTLPSDPFDGTVHMPAMHQAVKAYLANQRQGTASTKTRRFVTGGNQKPWRQKGTGRARQGSIRAPHWVGGGTVFGPSPRSYAQYVPRQVRALARKSALNARARENAIIVVDALDFESPKTKNMTALLEKLGGTGRKVLVLTNGSNPNVFLSGRNIPNVHVMPYSDASTYHVLWSELVVIEEGALSGEERPRADSNESAEAESRAESTAKRAAAKKPAKQKAAGKARAAAKSEKKPAAKKAAKKKSGGK